MGSRAAFKPQGGGTAGRAASITIVAAGEPVIAPPKALPPIRTSRKSKRAFASFSTAKARVVAAAAAAAASVLQQQQQRRQRQRQQRKIKKQRGGPLSTSSSPAPPLLPTSFARGALYKVEPKVFFSAERSLLAYLQAALVSF